MKRALQLVAGAILALWLLALFLYYGWISYLVLTGVGNG